MKQKPEQYNLVLLCFLILGVGIIFSFQKPQLKPAPNTVSAALLPYKAAGEMLLPKIPASITLNNQATTLVQSIGVPILMYHHVGYLEAGSDVLASDLTVSPADFESEVKYFKTLGFHAVTLHQVYDSLEKGTPLPSKPLVFTFDDGYKDVFTHAIPILRQYDYVGSFAIATNLLGRPSYADWDDIVAAHNSGMEIISHTENHLDLSNPIYSDADLHREIFNSKKILEEKLGSSVDFFVYPYGRYNSKVLQMVSDAGYKMALTTAFGLQVNKNSLLATTRVRVHGQDGLEKLKKIFSPVAPAPQSAPALLSP